MISLGSPCSWPVRPPISSLARRSRWTVDIRLCSESIFAGRAREGHMIGRKSAFALVLAAALTMGCADKSIKQMTTRPNPPDGGAADERRVVLFRVVVDVGDE